MPLLIAAIVLLGLVATAGTWLAIRHLLLEQPPARLGGAGLAHGLGGLAGFALLAAALWQQAPSAHAVRMGAGGFGWFAGGLIAVTLLGGLAILATQLRHRPLPMALIAAHAMLGIAGYTILVTYLTMLH